MKIQPIGICRYSLLVTGGFQRGPASLEERAAYLFDDKRLARRFAWFSRVTLPSLAAQEDKDFRFVVLASTLLPARWKGKLARAVADVAGIELEFAAPGPHHTVCNDAIRRRIDPSAKVVAQFRLDDDDAVARDYITRVRTDFDDSLNPLFRRFGAVAGDHARGLILEADGRDAQLWQTHVTTWPCAQTVYFGPDSPRALFDYGHHRLHAVMPTVTMRDANMFLRGRHKGNDSDFPMPTLDTREWDMGALKRRFDISLKRLQTGLAEPG